MRKKVWVEVDLGAIRYNLQQIKKRVGSSVKIMGVVKADGYGHGAVKVSKILVDEGIDGLCVENIEEGIELREARISIPILVLFPFLKEELDLIVNFELTPTIFEEETAEILSKKALERGKRVKIHINVDTGMGRAGVPHEEAVKFIEKVNKFSGIEVEGVYTHFSSAEEKNGEYSSLQISRFQEVIEDLKKRGINLPLRHIANSAAILNAFSSFNNCFNMVRPGLLLYGYYSSSSVSHSISLKPTLSLKSRVVVIKKFSRGAPLSYNRTYVTSCSTSIATLSMGYACGYPRCLSNKGEVLIRGERFPLVGRICMAQSLVDIGNAKVGIGDEAVLWGSQKGVKISIEEVSLKANTSPYELATNLSEKVPRIYLDNF